MRLLHSRPAPLVLSGEGSGAATAMRAPPAGRSPVVRTAPPHGRSEPVGKTGAGWRSDRWAAVAFALYLALAVPLVVFVLGDYRWFHVDEWDFLASRSATDWADLFRAHNEHWSTVPVLVYRALFSLFGVSSYVPYLLAVVVSHLAVAVLLRMLMRRVGVHPWVATVVAGTFVLFGPGSANIVWGFQVGFNTALACGLVHVLLVDREGPVDRRDWLALAVGLVGLMSAGLAPVMVGAAALVALVRRGPWVAAFHGVPLAVVYGSWYVLADAGAPIEGVPEAGAPTAEVLARWVVSGETGAFLALGQHVVPAVVLAAVLVVGLWLAWRPLDRAARRRRAAVPAALLLASIAVQVASGWNRHWLGVDDARGSRYLHVVAALTLPALAVAVDAIIRRRRSMAVPLGLLLVLPVPWQVAEFAPDEFFDEEYFLRRRALLADLATNPAVDQVPSWVRPDPDPWGFGEVSAGWLIDQRERGRLPDRPDVPPAEEQELALRFALSPTGADPPPDLGCERRTEPLWLEPEVGDEVIIGSPVWLAIAPEAGVMRTTWPAQYSPDHGRVLTVQLPDLVLVAEPVAPATTFVLCEPAGSG